MQLIAGHPLVVEEAGSNQDAKRGMRRWLQDSRLEPASIHRGEAQQSSLRPMPSSAAWRVGASIALGRGHAPISRPGGGADRFVSRRLRRRHLGRRRRRWWRRCRGGRRLLVELFELVELAGIEHDGRVHQHRRVHSYDAGLHRRRRLLPRLLLPVRRRGRGRPLHAQVTGQSSGSWLDFVEADVAGGELPVRVVNRGTPKSASATTTATPIHAMAPSA